MKNSTLIPKGLWPRSDHEKKLVDRIRRQEDESSKLLGAPAQIERLTKQVQELKEKLATAEQKVTAVFARSVVALRLQF